MKGNGLTDAMISLARDWLSVAVAGLFGRNFLERGKAGGGLGIPVLRISANPLSLMAPLSSSSLFSPDKIQCPLPLGSIEEAPCVKITLVREKGVIFGNFLEPFFSSHVNFRLKTEILN